MGNRSGKQSLVRLKSAPPTNDRKRLTSASNSVIEDDESSCFKTPSEGFYTPNVGKRASIAVAIKRFSTHSATSSPRSRKLFQDITLSDEHKQLIRLSWRYLVVVNPPKTLPAVAIFEKIFEASPELKENFGINQNEEVKWWDPAENAYRHASSFNETLDGIVREIYNLDAQVSPLLISIGARHCRNHRIEFAEDTAHAFIQGLTQYIKHVMRCDSFCRGLTAAARRASRSASSTSSTREESSDVQPIDDGDDDVMKAENDESENRTIIKETAEAWRLLARFIASKISYGYRLERIKIENGE